MIRDLSSALALLIACGVAVFVFAYVEPCAIERADIDQERPS